MTQNFVLVGPWNALVCQGSGDSALKAFLEQFRLCTPAMKRRINAPKVLSSLNVPIHKVAI